MTHSPQHISSDSAQDMDKMLHDFLGWIGNQFTKSVTDAGESRTMLGYGVKTQFAQNWESFLFNPIDSMYETRQQIDITLKKVIHRMVSTYLSKKKESISMAVRTSTPSDDLHYCVALKEDTLSNRIEINDFFDFYSNYQLANNFPVYIQFVPDELMGKINTKEVIVQSVPI